MSKFEFGFAKEDITPRRGLGLCGYFNLRPNRGFYDRLAVKAAAFRSGRTACAVVSFDLCLFPLSFVRELEKRLAKKKSPLAGKVLFCATHTHTGPFLTPLFGHPEAVDPDYMEDLKQKAVNAVEKAYASLAPAELWTGTTECTTLAFNRRYVMKNGRTLTNPGKLNPDIVRPEGGIDPSIIMAEIRQEGRAVMLMAKAHFVLHRGPLILSQRIDVFIGRLLLIIGIGVGFVVGEGLFRKAGLVLVYRLEVQFFHFFHFSVIIQLLDAVTIIRIHIQHVCGVVDHGDVLIVSDGVGGIRFFYLQTQVQLAILKIEQLTAAVGRAHHKVVEALIILHQIGLDELRIV